MENEFKFGYYARNEEEEKFDMCVRDIVRSRGNIADMALYIQNQAILSELRRIEEKLDKEITS